MSKIITPNNTNKLLPKLVSMSPYEVYVNQIKSVIETSRYEAMGMSYLPPQLGGITGQRQLTNDATVLQIIDFEVK